MNNPQQTNSFLYSIEKAIGIAIIRRPEKWYDFADLLVKYEEYAVTEEFRELIGAFRRAHSSLNDPTKFFIFLSPQTRRYWENLYWSEGTLTLDDDPTFTYRKLRETLAEVLARIDVKSILNSVSTEIETLETPLDVFRTKLLLAFHKILPREGTLTSEDLPKLLKYFINKEKPAKAFPFPYLESAMGFPVDIHCKDLTVLMGRTGRGKTTLSINIALELIKEGYNACYISTEMNEQAIATKVISAVTGKEWDYLFGRRFEPAIAEEALAQYEKFQEETFGKLFIFHKARCTVSDIASAASCTKALYGSVDLIVVDYIQQVESSSPRRGDETRAYELAQIVGELGDLAAFYNCAVVVVSQVNSQGEVKDARAIEERAGLAVRIGMLSEKNFLERVARMLQLQDKHIPEEIRHQVSAQYKSVIDIEVKKNRYGATDTTIKFLKIDAKRCRILGVWSDDEQRNWLERLRRSLSSIKKGKWSPPPIETPEFSDEDLSDAEFEL